MQINDLIFKELIKRGYSLEGNTRIWNIADSKLWYLTPEQAQSFLDLEQSEDYQKEVIQKEIDLINKNISNILEKVDMEKAVNIIDLGCGDGKKAVLFIEKLNMNNHKIRYCPIDISNFMVKQAIDRIGKLGIEEVIEFQWNISDFENLENVANLIRIQHSGSNFFLLLGNTLGNFEINELMYEVRSSMKEGDVLLIGNGLNNLNTDDLLKSYTSKEVDKFLGFIPLQIGLNKDEVKFGTRFKNSRVELYYTLVNDKKIKFQGKEVNFNKGDQVIVSVSYKYNKDDFKGFMDIYFDDVEVFTSEDNSYALALCKK